MKCKYLYLILVLSASLTASAQSQYRSSLQDYYLAKSIDGNLFLKRLQLGGGLHFIPGNADVHFTGYADSTYYNDSFKVTTHARQSYAFYLGSYIPITLISDRSMLVAEIEVMGSISTLVYDSIKLSPRTKILAPLDAIKVGVPISLEYRSGADVLLNKKAGSMFTLAAGINICGVNSNDYNKVQPYKFLPFIKVEFGFVAGLAFKFRGVYTFGNTIYNYTENYNVAGAQGDMLVSKFKGANGYNISLIIMPFSPGWTR